LTLIAEHSTPRHALRISIEDIRFPLLRSFLDYNSIMYKLIRNVPFAFLKQITLQSHTWEEHGKNTKLITYDISVFFLLTNLKL